MTVELYAAEECALRSFLETITNATPEQIERANAMAYPAAARLPLEVEGDTAIIRIEGILRKAQPTALMRFFGIRSTSYLDIIDAVEEIKGNPQVRKVRVLYDSPGGNVDGVDQAWQSLSSLTQAYEVTAEIHGICASAAFYLASCAKRIISDAPHK